MVYSNINLSGFGKNIKLKFYSRVTLLSGDSGIGKTLLYQMLNTISTSDKFKYIFCINADMIERYDMNLLKILNYKKNQFIVIDNADLILEQKEREFILTNHTNQYLIIGRNRDGLGLGYNGLGELVVTNKQMYIKYKLKEESEKLSSKKFSFEIRLP